MQKIMTRNKYNAIYGVINGYALWQQYKFQSVLDWARAENCSDSYDRYRDAMTDKYNATH